MYTRALVLLVIAGCSRSATTPQPTPLSTATHHVHDMPAFPSRPRASASTAFYSAWSDGLAELSSYRATVNRYGEMRPAEVVLVYVTEPMNRRTWIKDDECSEADRVNVLKLNVSLKFQTGVYPYSVLTSVFAPVDAYRNERFSPAKISISVQEWCGHVFQSIWPGEREFASLTLSYFASEGEHQESEATPEGALYEDALLIQLRELDGPFANGGAWHGAMVPSLWVARKAHRPARPVDATITRSQVMREGSPVHHFEVRYGTNTHTYDVETTGAHRVLSWHGSDGEEATLIQTARIPYWSLNHNGDEQHRREFGADVRSP
jgi:hypothetical protein